MEIVVIAFFLVVISGLDNILNKRQLKKVEERSDIQEETGEQEILQMWRRFYIIIYVILIIVIGFLTEFKMGFTTEPDYVSINCEIGDESITPVGDIQYVIKIIVIVVGLIVIFSVPIYDYFGWPIDVGYSYSDLLKLIDK